VLTGVERSDLVLQRLPRGLDRGEFMDHVAALRIADGVVGSAETLLLEAHQTGR
jgi:hypothetical protein